MAEFTNEDLKPGMLVELNDGTQGVLIPIKDMLEVYSSSLRAMCKATLMSQDITDSLEKDYAITRVYELSTTYDLFNTFRRDLLWEYEEPVKEMTITEIEAELGYKIKIVDKE